MSSILRGHGPFLYSNGAHRTAVQNYELTLGLDPFVRHQSSKICGAARVAPLIIVPTHYLYHPTFHYHGGKAVDDAAVRVPFIVCAD